MIFYCIVMRCVESYDLFLIIYVIFLIFRSILIDIINYLSVSLSLFLSLSLTLYLSLARSLSLSPSLSFPLSLSPSLSVSLPVTLFLSLSRSLSLPFSLSSLLYLILPSSSWTMDYLYHRFYLLWTSVLSWRLGGRDGLNTDKCVRCSYLLEWFVTSNASW